MSTTAPTWEQMTVLLIQTNDLVSELLDVLTAYEIPWPVSVMDRLNLFLAEAAEAGMNIEPGLAR